MKKLLAVTFAVLFASSAFAQHGPGGFHGGQGGGPVHGSPGVGWKEHGHGFHGGWHRDNHWRGGGQWNGGWHGGPCWTWVPVIGWIRTC